MFQDGEISLQQQDEITTFSETFYVKREYVVASIEHLTNLQSTKQIRARGEQKNNVKEKKESMMSMTGSTWYYKENLAN